MKKNLRWAIVTALCFCIAGITMGFYKFKNADNDLTFQKDDRIAIIGNTLADRMQEDGWLETYLQYRFPEKQLSFRNLGYSADEVKLRQREDQFGTPDEWLNHVGADVIFAFFGFNESFKGEAGLNEFKKDLREFIQHTKSQKYNSKSAPKLVLFSPIANEDIKSPFLPDGSENNKRIELYTKAMAEIAADENIRFVDLYTATKKEYSSNKSKEYFTINGIHLNAKGNKMIAQVIDRDLFGPAGALPKGKISLINEVVKDKDFHWFNRYRTTDGYNVYGGRSLLKWGDQTNRDVMMREMQMFEVMTDNRDKAVWEVAKSQEKIGEDGRSIESLRPKIDDSNLPEALPVLSYEKGATTPRTEPYTYLGGVEAISKMSYPKDLEVNLFASEEQFPDLINPHQMAFDSDDRLWIVTWATYPHWNPRGELNDKILIFPDEDGDGKADKSIVFADSLNSITGFQFWNDGVVVAAPPQLYFMKDTDGDGRADIKYRLLDGISSADSHHSANSFRIGPDGALYFSRGIFNRDATETPYGPMRSDRDGVYRFDPLTFEYTFHFPVGPNPHGDVFDKWGNQFATDATGGTGYYINIGKGQPARQLYEQKVRPVPGIGILSSEHFPAAYDYDFLIPNVIGFQGIKRHKFKYEGADIKAVEVGDLISSTDPNFRPSGVDIGGDGALYIMDWQNALIGHMQHNMRDPGRDISHGRIYRMTAKGRPLLKPIKMKGRPVGELLQHLRSKQDGVRYRVRIELTGRNTKDVIKELKKFSDKLNSANADDAIPLLECLWISQMHRVVNTDLLNKVLAVKDDKGRKSSKWN
jgi:lysophospholipase L1-like esterase